MYYKMLLPLEKTRRKPIYYAIEFSSPIALIDVTVSQEEIKAQQKKALEGEPTGGWFFEEVGDEYQDLCKYASVGNNTTNGGVVIYGDGRAEMFTEQQLLDDYVSED